MTGQIRTGTLARYQVGVWGLCATLLLSPLLAACGDAATGMQATQTPETFATATSTTASEAVPSPTTAATATPTKTATGTPPLEPTSAITPPLAQLTGAAGVQEAGLGTYCWQEGDQGLCADFTGTPVPQEALTVTMGEHLTINVPGITQLANIQLSAYHYADTALIGDERLIGYPLPDPIIVPFEDDGTNVTLTVNLPPGEYAIWLFVTFPAPAAGTQTPGATVTSSNGDAQYGFHIRVV